MAQKEIPSLTGIRAIAALLVFFFHAGFAFLPGGFAVTVFFFLSGYLITSLLRGEYESTGEIRFGSFYWKRTLRIFPPMYGILSLTLVATTILDVSFNWGAVVEQFLHLSNYLIATGYEKEMLPATGQYWSLSIEEHFYLLFPAALLFMLKRVKYPRIVLILAGVCLIELIWRCVLVYHEVPSVYIHHATDTRLDSILFGCILALWKNPHFDQSVSPRKGAVLLFVATVVLAVSFGASNRYFHDTLRRPPSFE